MRAAAHVVCLALGCGSAEKHADAPRSEPPLVTGTSPTLERLVKEVGLRFPKLAPVDIGRTRDSANLLVALQTQATVTIPVAALEALGYSIDAASRRTGRIRGACWTGDVRARTSTDGLGETLDERWHTSTYLAVETRRLSKVLEHPFEMESIGLLASASLELADTTRNRRMPELSAAWSAAWNDVARLPSGDGSGLALANEMYGFYGRFVSDDAYLRAGDALSRIKPVDARTVSFRIADLAVATMALVLDQAERPGEANELRALAPIHSLSDLASARTAATHASIAIAAVEDRTHALCNLVVPVESEDASDVDRWLAAVDSARALEVPKLDEMVRSLLAALARAAR